MVRTTTAEVLAEYSFPGVARVHGVTFDGQVAWIALGDRLQAVIPDGVLGRAIAVRAEAGSAFDGRYFYQIAGGKIQKVDGETGAIVAIVPAPADTDFAGLTWAEGALWVGQYSGRRILKIDPNTGQVLRTVRSDRLVTGVTFEEGDVWHGAIEGEAAELRRVDAKSGEVLETVVMPDAFVSGLEYNGKDRFYAGGGKSGRLRVIKRPKR